MNDDNNLFNFVKIGRLHNLDKNEVMSLIISSYENYTEYEKVIQLFRLNLQLNFILDLVEGD